MTFFVENFISLKIYVENFYLEAAGSDISAKE